MTKGSHQKSRKPILAFLLSLLAPGLGQIYNGQNMKGAILALIVFGSALLLVSSIIATFFWFAASAFLVISTLLYTALDAAIVANRIHRITLRATNRGLVYAAVLFVWFLVSSSIIIMFRSAPIQTFHIESPTMEPTIAAGEYIAVDMRPYHERSPARDELLAFYIDSSAAYSLIRRCIAVPGDTVEIRRGVPYVNGKRFTTTQVKPFDPDSIGYPPIIIPEDNCFVLADNMPMGRDSRHFGLVPNSLARGVPIFIYWSGTQGRIGRKLR